eukprot:Amastigsp_a3486_15.p2 type:complete len:355 gc:universal Amastigsp_a3486_15:1221-157(-)
MVAHGSVRALPRVPHDRGAMGSPSRSSQLAFVGLYLSLLSSVELLVLCGDRVHDAPARAALYRRALRAHCARKACAKAPRAAARRRGGACWRRGRGACDRWQAGPSVARDRDRRRDCARGRRLCSHLHHELEGVPEKDPVVCLSRANNSVHVHGVHDRGGAVLRSTLWVDVSQWHVRLVADAAAALRAVPRRGDHVLWSQRLRVSHQVPARGRCVHCVPSQPCVGVDRGRASGRGLGAGTSGAGRRWHHVAWHVPSVVCNAAVAGCALRGAIARASQAVTRRVAGGPVTIRAVRESPQVARPISSASTKDDRQEPVGATVWRCLRPMPVVVLPRLWTHRATETTRDRGQDQAMQ